MITNHSLKFDSRRNYPFFNRLQSIYFSMVARTKGDRSYLFRDIKVCDEWLGEKGFENFYDWSIENGYKYEPTFVNGKFQNSITLDRINPLGNYEPNNCRWTTWDIQNKNKSSFRYMLTRKERMMMSKIAKLPSCRNLSLKDFYMLVRGRAND